ncbi:MAG: response regulator [Gemmatimonadaceae bacterium]|nr:response regulator [Gemmatimonadaceae bacterium]
MQSGSTILDNHRTRDDAGTADGRALRLLDSIRRESFDRLARVAATAVGAPKGTVTIVDDEQQLFRSSFGIASSLDEATGAFSVALCRLVVGTRSPLVVDDLAEHPRLAIGHPGKALGVGSFVGVPLVAPSAGPIGALCVADTRPRRWTAREVELLVDLAAVAMTEAELRRELADRTSLAEAMFRQAPAFMAVIRGDEHVVEMVNDATYEFFGQRVFVGRRAEDALPELREQGFFELLDGVLATGEPFIGTAFPIDVQRRPGEPLEKRYASFVYQPLIAEDGKRTGILVHGVDITEQVEASQAVREREEQLRHAQKMEAVGQLAGGVAHDFNNLLTVLKVNSELLIEALDARDPRREPAIEIRGATDRAASLTRQLLAFSRKQILNPRVVDLNVIVDNVRPMLARLIGEDIVIATKTRPGIGAVLADAGQLEQILMNLLVNARDAMPDGGRVTIETANVELDGRYAVERRVNVAPGRYVLLSVSDSGTGMPAEVCERVFEPFFTTKEPGKGTGLGLSTVYGIVKQSGGYIWVYSEPGKGATFKIYFPRLAEETQAHGEERDVAPPPGGTETVLLVEDEDAVRRLARRILEQRGYTVIEGRNGVDALAAAERHAGHIDLVLTDVVMPGMSGRDLVQRLRERGEIFAQLFMSGYTDDEVVRRGVVEQGARFLQKPFTAHAMLAAVREALDRG